MLNRTQLGQRIREARQRAGLSQQQLASSVGVSDKTISAYEVGRVDPPLEALEKLGTATQHPIAYFVGDVESNIEARLDKIAMELQQIRETLKQQTVVRTKVVGSSSESVDESGQTSDERPAPEQELTPYPAPIGTEDL